MANRRPLCLSVQFFEKAASNVKENIGEEVQTDQLIKEACRNCLEQVRVHFNPLKKNKGMMHLNVMCTAFLIYILTLYRQSVSFLKERKQPIDQALSPQSR